MVVLSMMLFGASVACADTTLGGEPVEGNLWITVYDDGRIGVWRHVDGFWQNQIFSGSSKGSRLQFLIEPSNAAYGYSLGYFGGNTVSLVSNTLVNSSHIRAIWTAGGVMQITFDLIYQPGDEFYSLQWRLENIGSSSLTDIRFFHGQDTYFAGSDLGAGFWDGPNNTIGVQRTIGGQLRRMSLQSVSAPFGFDSLHYGYVRSNVSNGALSNTIDPRESTDNGYALEWRNPLIMPGQVWTITAYEKFADVAIGKVAVTAPILTDCPAGGYCDLTYTVQNRTAAAVDVTLEADINNPDWDAVIQSPASPEVTIPGSGSQQVVVRVSVPANALDGDVAHATLYADDGQVIASDTATVRATVSGDEATVDLAGLSQTYDGAPKAATASTTPPGLNVDITYNGSATRPVNAGSYDVVATVNDPNYQGSASGRMVISPRALIVTADPKTKLYGAADPALTYQVTGGSLAGGDSFSGALTRAAGEASGTYAIMRGSLTAGPNYNLSFIGSALQIRNTFMLTKSGNGSVTSSPAGLTCGTSSTSCSADFPSNSTVKIYMKPAARSKVRSVAVNGVNLGAVTTVTLRNLKKAPVIAVVFSP